MKSTGLLVTLSYGASLSLAHHVVANPVVVHHSRASLANNLLLSSASVGGSIWKRVLMSGA